MARVDLLSKGVSLSYAVEATAGTAPTTGFKKIKGLKEVPEMNPSPDTIETTTLDELEFKTYIPGLKDLGGSLGFVFNFTQEFIDAWETLVSAFKTGANGATPKATWFFIDIPGLTEGLKFTGEPSNLGLPSISVNSVIEITAFITPTNQPNWTVAPAYAA